MKKLYLIQNMGCDATTTGIAEMSDDELKRFLKLIKELNANSWYGCMPKISVYETDWTKFRKVSDMPEEEKEWLDSSDRLRFDGEEYTYAKGVSPWSDFLDNLAEDETKAKPVEVRFTWEER